MKNLSLVSLKDRKKNILLFKLFLLRRKFLRKKNYYDAILEKKPIKFWNSYYRKNKYKLKNYVSKLNLQLMYVRKLFLLLIIQNLKNKFLISFSILSEDYTFTDDMLIFIEKYMFIKYLLKHEDINYIEHNAI